ncbi:hypothetical protein [Neobacillus terrae]|uniref:hypothetical protein n=1 Tax=Neobacillus terrae TaxID=3034837 RepID=UPI003082A982
MEIYGTGSAAIVAYDTFHKFKQLGVKSFYYFDQNLQHLSASQLTKNNVAIIFSDLSESMRRSKS